MVQVVIVVTVVQVALEVVQLNQAAADLLQAVKAMLVVQELQHQAVVAVVLELWAAQVLVVQVV
jgi:hypothetical protein